MHTNRHSPQSEGGAFVGLDWDLGRNPAKQALKLRACLRSCGRAEARGSDDPARVVVGHIHPRCRRVVADGLIVVVLMICEILIIVLLVVIAVVCKVSIRVIAFVLVLLYIVVEVIFMLLDVVL